MSGKEKRKRPLSKSGFIAAMDCPVRLRHRRESLRTNTDHNDFMRLLAEGGRPALPKARGFWGFSWTPPLWEAGGLC